MNALIQKFNQIVDHPDLAKLVLRVVFGGMFLLYGIANATNDRSFGFIVSLMEKASLPGFFAYGVYLGQILAPILIIIGLFTRISAFVAMMTCVMIIGLAHAHEIFSLNKFGGWAIESPADFLFAYLAIMLWGSGKYAVKSD
ncbi:DoxX [[Pasteurella] aerogenes]|nr:DoxX [[Pasteurella] aerogenes]